MAEAFIEARKAFDLDEVPIGSVLVLDNQVVARGYNMTEASKNAMNHAEVVCIQRATEKMGDFRLVGSTLYTTLEPCIMCAGALILSRVDRIVYGCPDLRHGACGSIIDVFSIKHPIHRIKIDFLDYTEKSAQMLKQFFKQKRLK
ncbi:MAG: nucleoside deaminase [Simkaniaceae bacterium]|nr:nucleoside deaminase [Simkaniaceae bacterium]